MEVIIYGSCVTRDIFDFADKNSWVKEYFARQSVVSTVAKPFDIEMEEISLDSNFQKRMIYYDCNKLFFEKLEKVAFDCLIIDLIDERFGIWQGQNTYITGSSEASKAELNVKYGFEQMRLARKNEMWFQSCEKFVETLLVTAKGKKVFLHEAYWAREYMEKGEKIPFSKAQQKTISSNNAILREYYQKIKTDMKEEIILLPQINPIADTEHKWGLSPVHYTKDYYEKIFESLVLFCQK